MRKLIFGGLCLLILCKFFVHSFCYAENVPQKVSPLHSHPSLEAVSDVLWAASLVKFQELLKTDPESARAELQDIATASPPERKTLHAARIVKRISMRVI